MTDFEEMVFFLEKECVACKYIPKGIKRYTMKWRFGLTKDFYVDYTTSKCNMWNEEIKSAYLSTESLIEVYDSNFKTHIEIQDELDKFI